MNQSELRQAIKAWLKEVKRHPTNTQVKTQILRIVIDFEDPRPDPLWETFMPTTKEKPKRFSRRSDDKISVWQVRNVGPKVVGAFYDFLVWCVEQDEYSFTQDNLQAFFPEGRPEDKSKA